MLLSEFSGPMHLGLRDAIVKISFSQLVDHFYRPFGQTGQLTASGQTVGREKTLAVQAGRLLLSTLSFD